jgi:hypothetical protein
MHPSQTASGTQTTTTQATTTAQPATTQTVAATTATQATTTAQPTTTTQTATTTQATSTTVPPVVVLPPTTMAWPPPAMPIDPNLVQTWIKKATDMGIPVPTSPTANPTSAPVVDPIDATIRANAAIQAAGFSPAGSIARAKGLKINEHAGMTFSAAGGKCYMVFGAATSGVSQLALRVFFPATPPNAVIAEDKTSAAPVLGNVTKLCPPVAAQFRIDAELLSGSGDVGVQVWQK